MTGICRITVQVMNDSVLLPQVQCCKLNQIMRKEREDGLCPSSFPEAERKEKPQRDRNLRGSLTVEAAVCLPLLLFAVWLLIMPMRTINELRRLQNTMEGCAKNIAQAAYVSGVTAEFLPKDESLLQSLKGLTGGMSSAAAEAEILGSIDTAVLEGAEFAPETAILSGDADADENMIHIELVSRMRLPRGLFSLPQRELRSIVNRRAWTGADGGRGRDQYGEGTEEEEDPIVYIGKNSTRYHRDRHCHYLDNVVEAVSGDCIAALRNASGGTYHACPVCQPDPAGTVYLFKNGSAYHSGPDCRAIGAYVQSVRLSTVADMGGCSYCCKGE